MSEPEIIFNFMKYFVLPYLVVPICWSMTGEPDGGPGEGAAAGHDEGGHQIVILHIPAQNTVIVLVEGGGGEVSYFISADLSSVPG